MWHFILSIGCGNGAAPAKSMNRQQKMNLKCQNYLTRRGRKLLTHSSKILKNKEKALTILRSRLLEEKREEEAQKYAAHRKSQIGSGGREEKIRTYNFPQNRLTDHRIGLTLYNLDRVMEGEIADLIAAIEAADTQQRLEESVAQ